MISAMFEQGKSPVEAAADFAEAAEAVSPNGLEALFRLAIGQLGRFVDANIEIDLGRTKGSVQPSVAVRGNGVRAMLAAHTNYAPYVRNRSHNMQFMRYAEKKEVPNVVEALGLDVVVKVEGAFD